MLLTNSAGSVRLYTVIHSRSELQCILPIERILAAVSSCLFSLSLGKDRAMEGKFDWSELGPKWAKQSSLRFIDPPLVAAPTTMHFHSCTFIYTFHPMEVFLLLYCTLRNCRMSTNEIGRYLNYIQKRKSAARGTLTLGGRMGRRLSGSLYEFLRDVIHVRSIAWLRGFAKGLQPSWASLAIIGSK